MLISNANANNFLQNVNSVMRNDVVSEPSALICKVQSRKIVWHLGQKLTTACSSSWLESEVLQGNKPGEGQEVGDDDIWSHHLKHVFLALEIVHKH